MGSPAMNFIPAELVRADGATGVAVPMGEAAAVLPLHGEDAQAAPGRRVILGVRPEHLFRHHPGDARSAKPGVARLRAPVEVVEPTGSETHAVMRFGAVEVVGRFDPDAAPRMGETVELGVDMANACLFDPATERLI
jgi:multiple sugar transport system ATP-binding protein